VQAGKGGMFRQGFDELNLAAQHKFGGESQQAQMHAVLGSSKPSRLLDGGENISLKDKTQ
jgi:hypothetical protein